MELQVNLAQDSDKENGKVIVIQDDQAVDRYDPVKNFYHNLKEGPNDLSGVLTAAILLTLYNHYLFFYVSDSPSL